MSTPMDESFDIDPRAFLADDEPGEPFETQAPVAANRPEPDVHATNGPADRVRDADDAGIDALERVAAELAEVDAALDRLDEGRYGTCASCGEAIGDERLAVDPTARTCATHESLHQG